MPRRPHLPGLFVIGVILIFSVVVFAIIQNNLSTGQVTAGSIQLSTSPTLTPQSVCVIATKNNCFARSAARANSLNNIEKIPSSKEAELTTAITNCINRALGIDSDRVGVSIAQTEAAMKCKVEAVAKYGVKEKATTTWGNGSSPFKNNCPTLFTEFFTAHITGAPGQAGHAGSCVVTACDPVTGEARISCSERDASTAPPTIHTWTATVAGDGQLSSTNAPSINGGTLSGITRFS